MYRIESSNTDGVPIYQINAKTRPDRIDPSSYLDQSILTTERQRFILKSKEHGNQNFLVVDKSSPHSLLDLMVTVDALSRPLNFAELNTETRKDFLNAFYTFFRYCTQKSTITHFGLDKHFFRISANIALTTEDRFSIQGERVLHPHMICYDPDATFANQVEILPHDPIAKLGSQILLEMLSHSNIPEIDYVVKNIFTAQEQEIPLNQPGLYFELADSWETLLTSEFTSFIKQLDQFMIATHSAISELLCETTSGQEVGNWSRKKLLPSEVYSRNIHNAPFMSVKTKEDLLSLTQKLRNIPQPVLDRFRDKRQTDRSKGLPERIMAYAGPTYTYTFFSPGTILEVAQNPTKRAFLMVQPLLFRPDGAGGLFFNPSGHVAKIHKNTDNQYSEEEMLCRREFQNGYIKTLNHYL